MVATVPVVTNWSVTPQNGQVDYFTLMNTWLFESTSVIASLNTAINKINEAGQDINDIGTNAINAITFDNIAQLRLNSNIGRVDVLGYYAKGDGGGGTFYWDSTSTETDNGGTIIQATSISTGRWKRTISSVVNVKQFGAKGDGATDDTIYFQNAINYAKSLNTFQNGSNTIPRGCLTIYISSGIYAIGASITLSNINGFIFKGDGAESTILVATNGNHIFTTSQLLFNKFENFGIAAGTIDTITYDSPSITITANGSRTSSAFQWITDGGGDRFNHFENIVVKGGFLNVFNIGGANTHSENTLSNCSFFYSDYVWYSNNAQSIINSFNNCNAEFIDESVFCYQAGGHLTVNGGSYINPKNFIEFKTSSEGTGVGTTNSQFTFNNTKWEMFENIDSSKNPYIVKCTNVVYADLIFNGCNNLAGGALSTKEYFYLFGDIRASFNNCSIVGILNAKSSTVSIQNIVFESCKYLPTITQSANGGYVTNIEYINCIPSSYKSKFQSSNANKIISSKKELLTMSISAVISSATTYSKTFTIPSNAIITGYVVKNSKAGGVGCVIKAYADDAKTLELFSIDTGTTITDRTWIGTISRVGVSTSLLRSSTNLHIDHITTGNTGLVSTEIILEVVAL